MSGVPFYVCIGQGCQGILGKRRGKKEQQGGGRFRGLEGACRLPRRGQCGGEFRESGRSRGALDSGGRGLTRRVRRSARGGGGEGGEG